MHEGPNISTRKSPLADVHEGPNVLQQNWDFKRPYCLSILTTQAPNSYLRHLKRTTRKYRQTKMHEGPNILQENLTCQKAWRAKLPTRNFPLAEVHEGPKVLQKNLNLSKYKLPYSISLCRLVFGQHVFDSMWQFPPLPKLAMQNHDDNTFITNIKNGLYVPEAQRLLPQSQCSRAKSTPVN